MPSMTTVRDISIGNAYLGEAWRLRKPSCGHVREARCELRAHELGWELFLIVGADQLRRSQVCRSSDELLTTSETWKAALVDCGWS
jgi:hypothetical protein